MLKIIRFQILKEDVINYLNFYRLFQVKINYKMILLNCGGNYEINWKKKGVKSNIKTS